MLENQEVKPIINYDLFINKIATNNAILEYSLYEQKYNINIPNVPKLKVQEVIDYCNYKLVNGALVELTQAEKDVNKPQPIPTQQEVLNAQLLKSNAETKIELDKQKQLNSQLLLEVAKLKGGTTNV